MDAEYWRLKKQEQRRKKALEEKLEQERAEQTALPGRDENGLIMYSYRCKLCNGRWGASIYTLNKCPYCKKEDCNELIRDEAAVG